MKMINTSGLFVTLIDACNLDCPFCGLSKIPELRTGKKINVQKFITMLENVRKNPPLLPLEHVCFCGSGEPLLFPELIEIVHATKQYVPQVSIVTNGILLSQDISEALCRDNINYIVISVTGIGNSIYEKFHSLSES